MDYDRLERRRAGGGATGRTFGGDAFTLDQEDGLVGFALVLGAIAFDEHAGSQRGGSGGGRQGLLQYIRDNTKSCIIPLLIIDHVTQ